MPNTRIEYRVNFTKTFDSGHLAGIDIPLKVDFYDRADAERWAKAAEGERSTGVNDFAVGARRVTLRIVSIEPREVENA